MCADCAQTQPFLDSKFLADPRVGGHLRDLAERTGAPHALRPSDAPDWDWRAFLKGR